MTTIPDSPDARDGSEGFLQDRQALHQLNGKRRGLHVPSFMETMDMNTHGHHVCFWILRIVTHILFIKASCREGPLLGIDYPIESSVNDGVLGLWRL